jgi:hypothetical protein
MHLSAYKSTLNLQIKLSKLSYNGHHALRLNQLAWMVTNCVNAKGCSYEALSVSPDLCTKDSESSIKQTSRWLNSKWTDFESFYAPSAIYMLESQGKTGEILFTIDGSELVPGCTTLMLSMVWDGFSVPICWMTKKGSKGHLPEDMHIAVVELAQGLVRGIQSRIILLGDGEFDGERLRKSLNNSGWEFVLRTSKDRTVFCGVENQRFDSIGLEQGDGCVFLHSACNADNAVATWEKGYENPIYLLTNMELGDMACVYYKRRFKIETMFKQFKSAGFDIQKSKVKTPSRIDNLLIVISLAFIMTAFIGLFIKTKPQKATKKFLRLDRINSLSLIKIGQKCIKNALDTACQIIERMIRTISCIFARAA